MRSVPDRIRHSLMFEGIATGFVMVVGAWILNQPYHILGILTLMFSLLAVIWNFIFNWLFDLWDQRFRNAAKRTIVLRITHAILFEAALLLAGVFLISWWLNTNFVDAFMIDIGFSLFYLVYAFVFNWAYDVVFPIPSST